MANASRWRRYAFKDAAAVGASAGDDWTARFRPILRLLAKIPNCFPMRERQRHDVIPDLKVPRDVLLEHLPMATQFDDSASMIRVQSSQSAKHRRPHREAARVFRALCVDRRKIFARWKCVPPFFHAHLVRRRHRFLPLIIAPEFRVRSAGMIMKADEIDVIIVRGRDEAIVLISHRAH